MGSLVSAEVEWVWGLSALTGFPSTVRAMRCLLFWARSVCHFPSQRVLEALGSYVAVILPAPLLTWNKTWTKQTLGWVFLLRTTVFFALDLSQKTKKTWSTEHWWIVLRVEHLIGFWKHAARTMRNKRVGENLLLKNLGSVPVLTALKSALRFQGIVDIFGSL